MANTSLLGMSFNISVDLKGKKYAGNYRRSGATLRVFHRLLSRTVRLESIESAELVAKKLLCEMALEAAGPRGRSTYDYSVR